MTAAADTEGSNPVERISELTSAEKQQILEKRKRFDALSVEQQLRIRTLHEQVESHELRQRFLTAMNRYHEWLKTLSASERAELLDLSKGERLERIRTLKLKSDRERLSRFIAADLDQKDMRHVFSWVNKFASKHREDLKKSLPEKWRKPIPEKIDSRFSFMLLHNAYRSGAEVPTPTDEEVNSLIEGLSEKARKPFDDQKNMEEKKALLLNWIHGAVFTSRHRIPNVDDEKLKKFFEEKLSKQQQDELNKFTGDRFRRELTSAYWQWDRTGQVSWGPFGRRGGPDFGRGSRGRFGRGRGGGPDGGGPGEEGRRGPGRPEEFDPDRDGPPPVGPPARGEPFRDGDGPRRDDDRPNRRLNDADSEKEKPTAD